MRLQTVILLVGCVAVGCASKRPPAPPVATTGPETRPVERADLALEQIEPRPVLSTTRPDDTGRANLDAIELFAHARRAMLNGQRYTAINLLEKAVELDPGSYELRFWLGQAYAGGGPANEQSISAFEAAAGIDPDRIIVHSELGRQYLARGETSKSLEHLMLARQTTEYERDESAAAVVDFYLGKALQQAGYDRAALEAYEALIERLRGGGLSVRGNAELAFLVTQPEALFVQVGELMEKRGRVADAIELYELANARKGGDLVIQSHLARAYAAAGRRDDAIRVAAEVVRQFRGNPDSLALLRELFSRSGGDDALASELERLRRQRPDDRVLLYALVDILASQGAGERAVALLSDAAREARYETELVRRLFRLYDMSDQVDAAAKLLIEALAARPDNTRDIAPLWTQLLRPWRRNHLTVAILQGLKVSPQAQASKLFWTAEMARIWNRQAMVRSSLQEAVRQVPPFAPAFRALLALQWSRQGPDAAQKREASEELVALADRHGDAALAQELRGLVLVHEKRPAEASEAFARAREMGNGSPDLMLAYASALNALGQTERAEQALLDLARSHPTCEEAYLSLFRSCIQRQQPDKAIKVLQQWIAADPSSTNARILEATVYIQANRMDAAERLLDELFVREPENGDVLLAMAGFYNQVARTGEYIQMLEKQRAEHPENRTVVEQLALLYAAQERSADASRVLDAAREGAGNDPDLLYHIAGLYTRIGQKETTERVLEEIVGINSRHAAACNDLGYTWAEQGRNLNRAESLVRIAVESEPDNHSFLDSLGWVLYKRGRFDQALEALQSAVEAASEPDPVVLDHLGDTLYRLDRRDEAASTWKLSSERITVIDREGQRDDLSSLRLQLQQKLKQAESGQPVSVSPVVEESAKQAKN